MKKQVSSFSLSPKNIEYIDNQWEEKGKRNRSHWLDDLITHLRSQSESKKPPAKRKQFKAPNVLEVQQYMIERGGNPKEADRFCDFYEMKGWMVGKNKMKDWKAAVRNWLKGKSNETNQQRANESLDGLSDSKRAMLQARAERDAAKPSGRPTMGSHGGNVFEQVGEEEWSDSQRPLDGGFTDIN